jgi:hypothetical protein
MARASEPAHGLHSALLALADLNRIEGNLDAAERLYAEGLALSRSSGEQRFLVVDLVGLATVTAARGDAQRAQPLLREALAVCEDVGSKPLGSVVLLIGSGLAASNNEWQCAAELYGAATRHCEDTGYRPEPADEAFVAPLVERTRNALGVQFAEAESFGRTLSYESAMAQMRTWLTA